MENALLLKQNLLDLSRLPENKPFKSSLRQAADSIRNTAFGFNREVTKKKIIKLLDAENGGYDCLEIDDFIDETGLPETELRPALIELEKAGKIEADKRRRWQEPGKHYNDIWRLKK
jgi:predicted Rossmann fold nucleotide-binding protein DprA/Smf involved in DNA uptake